MQPASRPIGDALLHLATEVEPGIEADFNAWAEGHLKDNLGLSGFLSARRLRRSTAGGEDPAQPTWLTIYDLADLDALASLESPDRDRSMPAAFSGRFRFERTVHRALTPRGEEGARQPRGPAILHITLDVEPDHEAAFVDWYVGEHVPAIAAVPGVLSVRRFENAAWEQGSAPAASGARFLTIYELEAPDVIARDEMLEAARRTACPAALEPHRSARHQVYEEFLAMEAS